MTTSLDKKVLDSTKDKIEVRLVENTVEMDAVYHLTHEAYLKQGYCKLQANRKLVHYPHWDNISETKVLVARQNGEIIGTNSYTVDGPKKLTVDSDFNSEVDKLRRKGLALAASWRMATLDKENERTVVMTLIAKTAEIMIQTGATHHLFICNPRQEKVYQRLLNMKTLARKESTNGLMNAPAVLMMNTCQDVLKFLKRYQRYVNCNWN
ncbi:MAG: hypothetical protein QNJ37_07840 [Crocosphaera sp.]|nr:hypothetical protein [Crocosphaera sp.]